MASRKCNSDGEGRVDIIWKWANFNAQSLKKFGGPCSGKFCHKHLWLTDYHSTFAHTSRPSYFAPDSLSRDFYVQFSGNANKHLAAIVRRTIFWASKKVIALCLVHFLVSMAKFSAIFFICSWVTWITLLELDKNLDLSLVPNWQKKCQCDFSQVPSMGLCRRVQFFSTKSWIWILAEFSLKNRLSVENYCKH